MLVLARKEREAIEFPELGVVIRVVSLKTSKVQLGIDAPQRVKVVRSEVRDAGADAGSQQARKASLAKIPQPHSDRRFDSSRFARQLERLEAQILALGELATKSNRHLARQVVEDAQCQLQRLERLLVSVVDLPTEDTFMSEPKAPAFAVTAFDNDAASTSPPYVVAASAEAVRVRQSQAEFTVASRASRCEAETCTSSKRAYHCRRVVWFPAAPKTISAACF